MPYARGGRVKRVDVNHRELIDAAIAVGADVVDTHIIGRGVPDFIVLYRDRAYLVEAKGPDGTLTPAEVAYAQRSRTPVHVIRTVDQLLTLLGIDG
jgi:hypothetical protein